MKKRANNKSKSQNRPASRKWFKPKGKNTSLQAQIITVASEVKPVLTTQISNLSQSTSQTDSNLGSSLSTTNSNLANTGSSLSTTNSTVNLNAFYAGQNQVFGMAASLDVLPAIVLTDGAGVRVTGGLTGTNTTSVVYDPAGSALTTFGINYNTGSTLYGYALDPNFVQSNAISATLDGSQAIAPTDPSWSLLGGLGNDFIIGGSNNDTALGGAGNDNITGADGNDSLLARINHRKKN
jgi:hypothetical protein